MTTCPHCQAELTDAEAKTIYSAYTRSKRTTLSGGKIWKKHRPEYSRCRCPKCNAKRVQLLRFVDAPK